MKFLTIYTEVKEWVIEKFQIYHIKNIYNVFIIKQIWGNTTWGGEWFRIKQHSVSILCPCLKYQRVALIVDKLL